MLVRIRESGLSAKGRLKTSTPSRRFSLPRQRPEVLHPIDTVFGMPVGGVGHADFGVGGVHDVFAVAGGGQPGVEAARAVGSPARMFSPTAR